MTMFDDLNQTGTSNFSTPKSQRMTERTNNTKKKNNRKTALIVVAIAIIAMIAVGVSVFFAFRINDAVQIKRESACRYSDETIKSNFNAGPLNNLLLVNDSMLKDLEIACPYLEGCFTEKILPNTLIIHVKETTPLYYSEYNDGYALFNAELKVLETDCKTLPSKLTHLVGSKPIELGTGLKAKFKPKENYDNILYVYSSLTKIGIIGINEIDLTDKYNVLVFLDDGGELRLGAVKNLDESKLKFIAGCYAEQIIKNDNQKYYIAFDTEKEGYLMTLDETVPPTDENGEIIETTTGVPVTDESGETVTDEFGEVVTEEYTTSAEEEITTEEQAGIVEETTEEETTTAVSSGINLDDYLGGASDSTTETPQETTGYSYDTTAATETEEHSSRHINISDYL